MPLKITEAFSEFSTVDSWGWQLAKKGEAGLNQKGRVKGKESIESRRTGKWKKFPSAKLGWDMFRNVFCMFGFI